MNRSGRRIFFGILFALPVLAIGAACTFPDVNFALADDSGSTADAPSTNTETGSTSGSSGSEAGPEAGPDVAVATEGGILLDDGGFAVDVVDRPETSTPVDAAGCDERCDCDDDGYLKIGCDAATALDDASATKQNDCDDLDELVHPGQTYTTALPRAGSPKPGDFDCDGTVDKGILENFVCQGLGAGLCTDTTKSDKFKGAVGCGIEGDILNCSSGSGLNCVESFKKKLTQLCK